jgi:HEAT repeat protein
MCEQKQVKNSPYILILFCILTSFSAMPAYGDDDKRILNKSVPEKTTGYEEQVLTDFELMQKYGSNVSAAIPALIEGLKSDEVSIRRNAAFALGEIGPDAQTATEALTSALRNDQDIEVRRNAAFALGEIGSSAIPELLDSLGDKDSRMRRNVAAALVRIGQPAVPRLIQLLHAENSIIRNNAAGILGRIGPKAKKAIPALEKALQDEDKAFCWTVKQALRKIKQVTVDDLIECLNDKDIIIRSHAVESLGEMGPEAKSAVPQLILCLKDQKAEVRKKAALALAGIGKPALPALIESLQNEDVRIRKNAAFCLGEMGEQAKGALQALKKLLKDPYKQVRWCADNALKKIENNDEHTVP